jgi:hypothetical protein
MSLNRSWAEYGHVISKWLFIVALACLALAFAYLVFGPDAPREILENRHE